RKLALGMNDAAHLHVAVAAHEARARFGASVQRTDGTAKRNLRGRLAARGFAVLSGLTATPIFCTRHRKLPNRRTRGECIVGYPSKSICRVPVIRVLGGSEVFLQSIRFEAFLPPLRPVQVL